MTETQPETEAETQPDPNLPSPAWLTPRQREVLGRPLNGTRIAKRKQGGQELSYLESWDVRAHLIRVFGYGNFDLTMDEYRHVETRPYVKDSKDMVEVIYSARMTLVLKDCNGVPYAEYSEAAVGSTSGPMNTLGEHHDNALKTAASDAMKRCAINLGTQFGLSLYDHGNTRDVVKGTLLDPEPEKTDEQIAAIARSLGGEVIHTGS